VVCILAGHPEWCANHQSKLEKIVYGVFGGFDQWGTPQIRHYDARNEVMSIAIECFADPDAAKATLEKYFRNEEEFDSWVELQAFLHLPMFDKLRQTMGFKTWWEEWNHRFPVIDPDPTFQHASFNL
jgi:hypothetical protein